MKDKLQPLTIKYTETHVVQGNTLEQVLNNLKRHVEDQKITTAWTIQMFETLNSGWQAVLTKGV